MNSRRNVLEARASCVSRIVEDRRGGTTLLRETDKEEKGDRCGQRARSLHFSSRLDRPKLPSSERERKGTHPCDSSWSDVGKLTDLTDPVRVYGGGDGDSESGRRDEEEGEEEGEGGGAHRVEEREERSVRGEEMGGGKDVDRVKKGESSKM